MELSVGEIVKIVIAVLVVAVAVLGIYIGFRNYILPYFEGLGPSGDAAGLALMFLSGRRDE